MTSEAVSPQVEREGWAAALAKLKQLYFGSFYLSQGNMDAQLALYDVLHLCLTKQQRVQFGSFMSDPKFMGSLSAELFAVAPPDKHRPTEQMSYRQQHEDVMPKFFEGIAGPTSPMDDGAQRAKMWNLIYWIAKRDYVFMQTPRASQQGDTGISFLKRHAIDGVSLGEETYDSLMRDIGARIRNQILNSDVGQHGNDLRYATAAVELVRAKWEELHPNQTFIPTVDP